MEISSSNTTNTVNTPQQLQRPVLLSPRSNVPKSKPDSFERQNKPSNETEKDKKNSLLKKIALLGASIALGAGVAIVCLKKSSYSSVKKLSEHIDFTEAQTIEEGIRFGKANLGIKNYIGFEEGDIDVLNWINRGLTNTANAHKGNLRMPKNVAYLEKALDENTLAGVTKNKKYFCANKDIFKNFDKSLDNKYNHCIKQGTIQNNQGNLKLCHFLYDPNEDKILNLLKRHQNKEQLTFDEKIKLYSNLSSYLDCANSILFAPYIKLKIILTAASKKGLYTEDKVAKILDEAKNAPIEKQRKYFSAYHKMLRNNKFNTKFPCGTDDCHSIIYHEMGHIQDIMPRCKTVYDFDHKPEKYSKELKEWVNNAKNIETANCVSDYATSGPGEFIAETYAGMLSGQKFGNNVMELYKSLNGPVIPDIAA